LLASLQPILANVLQQKIGAARLSVPFTLSGTLDNPQFALNGTPQLITGQGSSSTAQLPAAIPSIQNLVNLIPGI
jgi:hypothetical protein